MGVGRVPVALHAGGSGSELVGARTPWVSALGSVFGARVAERGFRGLCCRGVRPDSRVGVDPSEPGFAHRGCCLLNVGKNGVRFTSEER